MKQDNVDKMWEEQAKREGRTVKETQSDFLGTLAEEQEEETKRLYDVKVAQQYVDDAEPPYEDHIEFPWPTKVIEVIDARFYSGFKEQTTDIDFNAYCTDEKIRRFKLTHRYFAGDFENPPDMQTEVYEVKDG